VTCSHHQACWACRATQHTHAAYTQPARCNRSQNVHTRGRRTPIMARARRTIAYLSLSLTAMQHGSHTLLADGYGRIRQKNLIFEHEGLASLSRACCPAHPPRFGIWPLSTVCRFVADTCATCAASQCQCDTRSPAPERGCTSAHEFLPLYVIKRMLQYVMNQCAP
jgi:hypothetical protein